MRYIFCILALAALWLPGAVSAQTDEVTPAIHESPGYIEPLQGISFTITTTNAEMLPGSTNQLQCHLMNLAETGIVVFSGNASSLTGIILTNSAGQNYFLNPPATNTAPSAGLTYPVAAGEELKWSLPLIIDPHVKPGTYRLIARQLIKTTTTPPVIWQLEQTLAITIKDKPSFWSW